LWRQKIFCYQKLNVFTLTHCSYNFVLPCDVTRGPLNCCDEISFWTLVIKPTRYTNFSKFVFRIKLYMFRTVPLSIIRNFSLYTQHWYMSYRFADSLRAGSGRNCSSCFLREAVNIATGQSLRLIIWLRYRCAVIGFPFSKSTLRLFFCLKCALIKLVTNHHARFGEPVGSLCREITDVYWRTVLRPACLYSMLYSTFVHSSVLQRV